jgi:hypothetical protein
VLAKIVTGKNHEMGTWTRTHIRDVKLVATHIRDVRLVATHIRDVRLVATTKDRVDNNNLNN